jgi:subtilisin-like proprotein convertase family protein
VNDLRATLTTPWGVVVELLPRGAGGRTQAVKITYDEAKLPALSTLRGRNSQGAWKLTVQDLGPADKGTLSSWDLDIGSAATTTGPVELKKSPGTQIPDYPAAGIERSLTNGKAFAIGSVEVSVDISHTFIGDLQESLVSPQGTAIVLHNGGGASTHDLTKTYTAAGTWQLRVVDRAAQD